MAQLINDYPNEVQIVYRHFPLNSIHDKAALAAQAAEAAGVQSKFWEMHDLLFERQSEWTGLSLDEFQEWLVAAAQELSLNIEQFSADLTSEEISAKVEDAYQAGTTIGLPGTPFLSINGRGYQSGMSYQDLSGIIDFFLLESRLYDSCPPLVIDPEKQYQATIQTEVGEIVLELYPERTPLAVNNFVFLAQEGWYDGITFHRVIPGFVAQTGDPSNTGLGGPGYEFDNEVHADLLFDAPGVVGMANHGVDTNQSQFFITMAEIPDLDGGYTIFGRVISGMEVVDQLTPRDPSQGGNLPTGTKIIKVTIEEK